VDISHLGDWLESVGGQNLLSVSRSSNVCMCLFSLISKTTDETGFTKLLQRPKKEMTVLRVNIGPLTHSFMELSPS
jgi:hypothetical protein